MKKLLVLSLLSVLLLGSSFVASAQTTAGTSGTVVCITEPCPTTTSTPEVPPLTTTATPSTTVYTVALSDVLACHQAAVAARESSILSAFTAYQTSMQSALTTRASALNTAWGNSDAKVRKTETTTAWNTYRKASQANNKTFTNAKNAGWKAYNIAVNVCKKKAREAKLAPLVLPLESANNDFKTI